MDKKPKEINENLIPTKISKHTAHAQQLIYLKPGQPSYPFPG